MPIDVNALWLFVPIALALNLTPGADMLFCLGQGAKSGPRAGMAASLGITTGSMIQSMLAGLGLASLIASHPWAFELVRWLGVAYLLWLAFTTWRRPSAQLSPVTVRQGSALAAWRSGIFVCLLNPKVALFILALVPQFVDPSKGSILVQFLIFGGILGIGGTIINGLVGIGGARIAAILSANVLFARLLQLATSFIFVGLAARLALDRR